MVALQIMRANLQFTVPASEITGEPHEGIAMALEALITPILEAKRGDVVAVGASLVLTPDDLLFSDAGLSLYRLASNGRVVDTDILDGMAENYDTRENQVIRSLHFMMNTDYFFEQGLRMAALELSPLRSSCLSLEFIMLGEALLLAKSDLPDALLNRKIKIGERMCLGDIIRSLWFAPINHPDSQHNDCAAKCIEAFLTRFMPLRTGDHQPVGFFVPTPVWQEAAEPRQFLHDLHTWNVAVS